METYYIIYETTNEINGKKYRGIHKTNNINDGYLGSGIALEQALEKYGKQNFSRQILEFCSSYEELIEKEKVYVDQIWVMDKNNYNLKTGGQSSGILSEESKNKISETLKRKYESGEINKITGPRESLDDEHKEKISKSLVERYQNEEHPRKGKEPWNKGKKKSQVAWNKGLKLGPQSEESKKKKSESLRKRFKNQEHHSKGREPWNKGKKKSQVAWNKGMEMQKVECPHCGKLSDVGNAKRWHFDNCKVNNK